MKALEEDASASIKVVTSIFFLAWITSFAADMLLIVSNFFGNRCRPTTMSGACCGVWRAVIGGGGGRFNNSYVEV